MKPPLSPPQPFICSQRRQKACFLSPRTGSKITVTKEKERRKSRSEEKERKRTEKKSNSCTLSFYNGYFSLWPKKLSDAKGPFGDR